MITLKARPLLLIIASFVISAVNGRAVNAQTPPNNWFPCVGCPTNYTSSPQAACESVGQFYTSIGGAGGPMTLEKQGHIFLLTCHYQYPLGHPHYVTILSACPIGYVGSPFAPSGCQPPPYPKSLGNTCCNTAIPMVGNPVSVYSGNKFEQAVDFRSSGINKLEFVRSYNTLDSFAGSLGINWRHNFERQLGVNLVTGQITVFRDDGRQLSFFKSAGTWISNDSDVPFTLVQSSNTFILTTDEDVVETYDNLGLLVNITYRNGYTQTLLNDGNNRLVVVLDNQGRGLSFTYNSAGLLETMTDPDNNTYTYYYSIAFPTYFGGNIYILSQVVRPATAPNPSPTITYHYENANVPTYLTGITDELGNRFATWTYDIDGRVLSSEHAGQAEYTTITYDSSTTRTVTSPLGERIKYTFAILQNTPKLTREDRLSSPGIPAAARLYTYDNKGYLASRTDWNGNKTTFINNSIGLQTSRTEAFGTSSARTITTAWHPTFRLPIKIIEPRKTTDFTYDANGNLLTRTETDTTTHTVPYSTSGQTRVWSYTYDNLGRVLTETGPRTDVTATTIYNYDNSGNLNAIINPLGHQTQITSYNNRGLPLSMTDANGTISTFTYDPRGRLLLRTINTSPPATTTFEYNEAGLLTAITLPDGILMTYEYDNAHRLTSVGNSAGERIEYTLDAANNINRQDIKNSSGTIVKTQQHIFDNIGRLLQDIGASSQTTIYGYDSQGNRQSIKNALGDTISFAFDALNRLIAITDPLIHSTGHNYDEQDNLTTVTDPRMLATSYVNDGFGQVIQETSPDRGTTIYVLDKAGNRITETDARGIVTNRTFDKLDRLTSETYPTSSVENVIYTYDDSAGGNKGIGHLTGFTDESGDTILTYDERGNVILNLRTIETAAYFTIYEYDIVDQLTKITYPSGREVFFSRDELGRISNISTRGTSGAQLARGIKYLPFGPLTQFSYGNGLIRNLTFDQDYRLIGITSDMVQDLILDCNGVDNIMSITDKLNSSRDQSFDYDKLYRLTYALGVYGSIDYTYDANGNRVTRSIGGVTQTSTYPPTSNTVLSISNAPGTRNFTYLPNGNIATDDRGSASDAVFTCNNRNRNMQAAIGNRATANYLYNARGERVSKSIAGASATHYHYDEDGLLLAESNGTTGLVIREYVWLDDLPLAQIEASGDIYYIHPDHLNTPQRMTDVTQTIVWDRQQEPFGEDYLVSGNITNNLRFPGQIADAETSLNYNYFRDYDSSLGRYIQTDPIGLIGGFSLFDYVGQNPSRWIDPLGLWPKYLFSDDYLFPETKQQVEKNLPTLLQHLAPEITLSEAMQLTNDIVTECGLNDFNMAQSFRGLKSIDQLSNEQKDIINNFIGRLPSHNAVTIKKLKKSTGFE